MRHVRWLGGGPQGSSLWCPEIFSHELGRSPRAHRTHDNFFQANKRSMYRHIVAYEGGEIIDPESGCKHLAMVALRAMIAIEYGAPLVGKDSSDHVVASESSSTLDAPTLYDWSVAPQGYNWAATDCDGEVWSYHKEPVMVDDGWYAGPADTDCQHLGKSNHGKPWQDSLEQRPAK